MRNTKSLVIVVALLLGAPIFAEEVKSQNVKVLSEIEIKEAIGLLLKAGILSAQETDTLVKRASILDVLSGRGRVQTLGAAQSSICGKQK
tara:strand:- start:3210 stop:3479 length:270 start_codon:yes stop_codon:yes gene_type:complete